MRVLVCGSREFENLEFVTEILDYIAGDTPIDTIITGAARGADNLAELYAAAEGIMVDRYPANWRRYGRSAGQMRNRQMLAASKPDLVVAFKVADAPGKNVGTNHMIAIAKRAGVTVEEHYK